MDGELENGDVSAPVTHTTGGCANLGATGANSVSSTVPSVPVAISFCADGTTTPDADRTDAALVEVAPQAIPPLEIAQLEEARVCEGQ